MKERSTELIIRWWRQPAGQHKLTEVHYDMNNFNRSFSNAGFEILTSYWLVIALRQHYDVIDWSDYQREKSITILKHNFAALITVLKTTYTVYFKYIILCQAKTGNVVNFRLYFIETTIATIFF